MTAIRQPSAHTTELHPQSADPTAADSKEPALKIHPAADIFPMLSEDELLDLAESIKNEGLRKAIVVDSDGVLLDGRNRLAACEIASVEPRFTTYTGDNPRAFILSSNVYRRHLSKGQQAMITAMACSVSGHSLRDLAKTHSLSRTRLSAANIVLTYSPELAEQVRVGAYPLDAAYDIARENKAKAAAFQEKRDRLSERAPDLAQLVTEGHLTLDEAIATLEERQEDNRIRNQIADADELHLADGHTTPPLAQLAEQGDITWHQAHQRAEEFLAHRQEAIHCARQAMERIAENWGVVRDLAARPDSAYAREIVEALPPEARTLAQRLIRLD
ncbi:plasmid replication/partition related protein [Streptomyces sp. XM83C]|uniref:ParB N-terminal domain-containing protein n=1 Tax=Streptomyces sp. XM83C TaxID=2929781 RepID=UPI001FFA5216|nr:ParB N-terminal domain-containing protein [Streptomyces sp. XM83C]MCK1819267.1 plasmid replication/partition related protein [Streptomyces sp. XM83C]